MRRLILIFFVILVYGCASTPAPSIDETGAFPSIYMDIADNFRQYQATLGMLQEKWTGYSDTEQVFFAQYQDNSKAVQFHNRFVRQMTHASNMHRDVINAIAVYLNLYEGGSTDQEKLTEAYEMASYFQTLVNNAVTPDIEALWEEFRVLLTEYGASRNDSL
jgi:hypothetical protein